MLFIKRYFPLIVLAAALRAVDVPVTIDVATPKQVIEGFGATWTMEYLAGATPNDMLTASQRARVLDAQFNQIKINLGQTQRLDEAPQSSGSRITPRVNDNTDPFTINWAGINDWGMTNFKSKVIDAAPVATATGIYPGILLRPGESTWLNPMTEERKQVILDECAEKTLATVIWWTRDRLMDRHFVLIHKRGHRHAGGVHLGGPM